MSCLGGTWQEPRQWMRFINGEPVGEYHVGRVCDETIMPWTSTRPRKCGGCPAYRGPLPDGGRQEAIAPDGSTINSLSMREYVEYVRLEGEAELYLFYEFLEGGVKGWTDERKAEYMKRYRAENPEYRERERGRKRKRDRAAYMRDYRASKRNPVTSLADSEQEG